MVLSGGGANGAYQVGVMKALFAGHSPATGFEPLTVDHFYGTSIGAYNAAILASQPEASDVEALAHLERIWLDRIAHGPGRYHNGVYRLRGNPLEFLSPQVLLRYPVIPLKRLLEDALHFVDYGLHVAVEFLSAPPSLDHLASSFDLGLFFSLEPLHRLQQETLDLEALARSSKTLTVVVADWMRAVPRFFTKEDISGSVGRQAIQASVALPGIFPPVQIDDSLYVDGAVLLNTPLLMAMGVGAHTVHAVHLQAGFPTPMEAVARFGSARAMYRVASLNWFSQVLRNLRFLQALRSLAARGVELEPLEELRRQVVPDSEWSGFGQRVPVVHVHHPSEPLGNFRHFLDFKQARIEHLIELGYADTVNHDCEANACVLADPESEEVPSRASGEAWAEAARQEGGLQ